MDIQYPDLEQAARRVSSETATSKAVSGLGLPKLRNDSDIPLLDDLEACALGRAHKYDVVVLVECPETGDREVPTREQLARVITEFPNCRVLRFDLFPFFTGARLATLSTEAVRLLRRLIHLKARDIAGSGRPLSQVLPENYGLIFVATGFGTTVVKECLLNSRRSSEPLQSSPWEGCRGIVGFNPITGTIIRELRSSLLPSGFWQKHVWPPRKRQAPRIAAIADEAEEVEISFAEVVATSPPRYSIITKTTSPPAWGSIRSAITNELVVTLRHWSTQPPNPPVTSPTQGSGTRLLSLDGGGIKGISGAIILNSILRKVRELETNSEETNDNYEDLSRLEENGKLYSTKTADHSVREFPSPKPAATDGTQEHRHGFHRNEPMPAHYFDLAGGTSTGGLMAVMLFRLGMCTECTIRAYEAMANSIFPIFFLGMNVRKWFWPGFGNMLLYTKIIANQPQFKGENLIRATSQIVETMGGEAQGADARLLEDPVDTANDHGKM